MISFNTFQLSLLKTFGWHAVRRETSKNLHYKAQIVYFSNAVITTMWLKYMRVKTVELIFQFKLNYRKVISMRKIPILAPSPRAPGSRRDLFN